MRTCSTTPASALIVAMALVGSAAAAQDVAVGAELYAKHCATCHGIELAGKGPMAPVLLLQPPDLNTLTERNGGTFPFLRVVTRIDGRDPLVAHGSPMPVYGDMFDGVQQVAMKLETGQPVMVSQPVADLVVFLQDVQNRTE